MINITFGMCRDTDLCSCMNAHTCQIRLRIKTETWLSSQECIPKQTIFTIATIQQTFLGFTHARADKINGSNRPHFAADYNFLAWSGLPLRFASACCCAWKLSLLRRQCLGFISVSCSFKARDSYFDLSHVIVDRCKHYLTSTFKIKKPP